MRPITTAIVVLAAGGSAAPALAQSGDWSGPYVGGRIGIADQSLRNNERIDFDTNLDGNFDDTVNTVTGANAFARGFCGGSVDAVNGDVCTNRNGVEFAVHAGYDLQFPNNFVIGAVAEYGRSRVENGVTAFSSTPAFYTFTRRLRGNGSVRLRAGYSLGTALVYGTAGIAFGKIDRSFSTSNGVNSFTESGRSGGARGYRVGGGVEQKLTQQFTIGAQYLYSRFKDDSYSVRVGGGNNVPVSNPFILTNPGGTDLRRSNDRFSTHNASIVANFRF